jgi:type IV pilus assembly protein PilE
MPVWINKLQPTKAAVRIFSKLQAINGVIKKAIEERCNRQSWTCTIKPKQKGFTLIEVMIVVVIVAILAAVALPSYTQYVERTRRVDAREALTRLATIQERFFFQNSRYTTDGSDLGGVAGNAGWPSPEGWYTITLTNNGCNADVCDNFTFTATAVGAQAGDDTCQTFTIDQTLRQRATGTGGDTTDKCW